MDAIEEIAGDSRENILEYDWPTPRSAKSYFWSPFASVRGSIRLFLGRVIGQDEVDSEWEQIKSMVKKAL